MSQEVQFKTHKSIGNSQKPALLAAAVKAITERVISEGDKPHATVVRRLEVLKDLQGFPLGRFLLINRGLNGYWTHYVVSDHPEKRRAGTTSFSNATEKFLFDEAPGVLATQERFVHFKEVLQDQLKEGTVMASIPSGLMGELLTLDLKEGSQFKFVGIDIDTDYICIRKIVKEYF